MLIDTTDYKEMERFRELKEKLIVEKLKKGKYSADDVALVRVSNHLPIDGTIKSISNVPFVCKLNDLIQTTMYSIVSEGIEVDFNDLEKFSELKNESFKYCPYSTQYRSTVHFCLNGVVSSHMYGNFEGRSFVVIEPFSAHEEDSNILAVRPEDTYFEDEIKLSNQAIILVNEDKMDEVLTSNIEGDYKIVFYRGEQNKAVESVLLSMGIVPEQIGEHNAKESKTSELLTNFIRSREYPSCKHSLSEYYINDDEKNLILWKEYANNFYTYLYTNVYGDITGREEEIEFLTDAWCFDEQGQNIIRGIVDNVGLENYKTIVDGYNSIISEQIEKGTFPTNNQILAGVKLDIMADKEKSNSL